jgi:dipeptide transport system substrate-binding protein
LLAKAGLPQGFEIELWALPISRSYNPDGRKLSEMVQADWSKIGVKAKIVTYEWGEYIKRASAGEHQAITLGWSSDNGDPDNMLTPLLACGSSAFGLSRWCDRNFEALLEKGRHETDPSKRASIYRETSRILQREVPILPISYGIVSQPMRKEVEGYHVTPLSRTYLHGVELGSRH